MSEVKNEISAELFPEAEGVEGDFIPAEHAAEQVFYPEVYSHKIVFPASEYAERIARLREEMERRGLAGLMVTIPENIYYLCGLDHMGYFAYQALILPKKGEAVLVTRAMEQATVWDQVNGVRHVGYKDHEDPAEVTIDVLRTLGLTRGRIGLEKAGNFLSFRVAETILEGSSSASWEDSSELVSELRLIKSPLELECTRRAAAVSDAMMRVAIDTAGAGVNERQIMAELYRTMILEGGTYPGFVPLVRSTRTIKHEHGTWSDTELQHGDVLFLEMSGCVQRYHAPIGRLVFIGDSPPGTQRTQEICNAAMEAVQDRIAPGVKAGDVYGAWQQAVKQAGLSYRRHHCGYTVGIGFPPSWSGGGVPVSLRPSSDMVLQSGMVFHLMSWLLEAGTGDFFLSDTAIVTDDGCELLTSVHRYVTVK